MPVNGNGVSPQANAAMNGEQPQEQQPKFTAFARVVSQFPVTFHEVAATIGNVGRVGVTQTMKSYSQAMQALIGNDNAAARQAAHQLTETAARVMEFNRQRLNDYSSIWSSDAPIEQKMASIQNDATAKYQDELMANLASENNPTAMGRYIDAQNEIQGRAEGLTKLLSAGIGMVDKKFPEQGPQEPMSEEEPGPDPEGEPSIDKFRQ